LVGGSPSEASPRQKHETLPEKITKSEKQNKTKNAGSMAQGVEYLFSKHEGQNSNPNTTKHKSLRTGTKRDMRNLLVSTYIKKSHS
jgi:hypothetical protein